MGILPPLGGASQIPRLGFGRGDHFLSCRVDDIDHTGTEPTINDQAPLKPPSLQAINRSKGETILARHVEWAGTSRERRRGLTGRAAMGPDVGIYLVPCEGIHTFGMKFPIDVAFLDTNGKVMAVHHSLKPWRLSKIVFRAEGVLELAAGRLRETDTGVGDVIKFRESGTSTAPSS